MKDPIFVPHFRNKRKAIQALQVLIAAKEEGLSNNQVLDLPFFLKFFNQQYLVGKTKNQLEIKLKNIARDLKTISFDKLNPEFHEFKNYFESTRIK